MLRIAVIGSEHDRTDSIAWKQPFPNFEEYDALIVDLLSLDQGLLDSLLAEEPNKLKTLGQSVN